MWSDAPFGPVPFGNVAGSLELEVSKLALSGPLVGDAARAIPVDMLIGSEDWNIGGARDTRDELTAAGFEVRYEEIAGWGHCCFRSERADGIFTWLLAHRM